MFKSYRSYGRFMAHIVYFDITAHSPGPNDAAFPQRLGPEDDPPLRFSLWDYCSACGRLRPKRPTFEVASIRPNTSGSGRRLDRSSGETRSWQRMYR